jgi:uncharacterized protein YbjQ (UPF0145 family)
MGATAGAFTSDLSVNGYALCDRLGLRPIHQVMGSSIYQVGYQGSTWPMMLGGTIMTELETLSQAWNEVRENALGRMAQEARELGAHAVVGVQLRIGSHDWAEGAIEYMVLGTAVHREGVRPTDHPVLTELSVSDYAKLVQAGMEPAGIAAWSSVFFAAYSFSAVLEMGASGGGQMGQMGALLGGTSYNYELKEFTQAFYSAREQVMENMSFQAKRMDASGIVGVRIEHSARRETLGGGPSLGGTTSERSGLVVEFHAIGTAIKETAGAKLWAPETTIDLTS